MIRAHNSLVYTPSDLVADRTARRVYPSSLLILVAALLVTTPQRASAQAISLKSDAPVLLTPVHGTQFDELPSSVTVSVSNARGSYVQAAFDHRFEVYDATDGLTLVVSTLVSSEQTTTAFGFSGPLEFDRVYQWRVRAERDGAVGPWTDLWSFEMPAAPVVSPPAGPLGFTDITVSSGVNGPPSIPLGGHGAAFADVTGDERPDLYITTNFNDPVADQFFVAQGGGFYAESGAARGIDDFDAGSHGGAFGDLDNDGDFDLVNGTTGTGFPNDVFRNDGGTFTRVTPSAILSRSEGTRGVVTFDMDGDGDLDIFAVNGWLGSGDPSGERNELYRNDGGLQFTEITSGAAYTAPSGQGVTDVDYDGDGDIDLMTGNRDGDLVILNNDGTGTFSLVDPDTIGITHRAFGGVTMADIDDDSDLDALLVGLDSSGDTVGHLYRNLGAGTFEFLRSFTSIDGYMGGFADLDHDGDVDLAFAGDNLIYLNDGAGTFSTGPSVPVGGINDPRAIAFADVDDDGDPDFAIGVKRSLNWLVRNELNGGNWLKIKLLSPQGQAGAFGAKVTIFNAAAAGTPAIATRESRSNNGYLGQDDPVIHVGLGDITMVNVMVTFLDGTTRILSSVASNQTVTVDGSTGGSAAVFVEQYRSRR